MIVEIDGDKTDVYLAKEIHIDYYETDYIEFVEDIIDGDVKVLKTDLNDKKKIITEYIAEYLYDNRI